MRFRYIKKDRINRHTSWYILILVLKLDNECTDDIHIELLLLVLVVPKHAHLQEETIIHNSCHGSMKLIKLNAAEPTQSQF